MKKKIVFVIMTFFAIECFYSCDRDNPVVPGDFDTYEEIEEYCINNGWQELNHVYDYYAFSGLYNRILLDCFSLKITSDGTLSSYNGYTKYKLFTSFSKLISTVSPPQDGYVTSFTCDNLKFGICKECSSTGDCIGYSKFCIKRMDDNKIKILYKKCDWPVE